MKKFFNLLLLGFVANSAIGQYNPNVGSPVISPAPMPFQIANTSCGVSGNASLQFTIGNTGSSPLSNLAQPLVVNITLARGVPSDVVNVSNAISGTFKTRFSWTYNSGSNNIIGTQIASIGGPESGTIGIAYVITSTSVAPGQNGMNVNITPPGYTLVSNTAGDDNVAVSTYTTAPPPRIDQFDTICFNRGQNFNLTAKVSNITCGGWFHWQYKAPCTGGNWVYLNNGLNIINGHIFNMSNAAFSSSASYPASGAFLSPSLNVVDAIPTYTNELDNVLFRVLMTTNGIDPQNTTAANIYGGEEYLNSADARTIGLYPTGLTWTCTGCAANQASTGPTAYDYYGGFERPVISENFFAPNPPTNATNANTDLSEWTGGPAGNNSFKIMNNPDVMNTSFAQIAPRSGNQMLVVNQVSSCTNTRIWYRTITTPVTTPDTPYFYKFNMLMRAWFAKLNSTDPNVPLILQVRGAPTRTSTNFTVIANSPITVSGNAGCWTQNFIAPSLQGADTGKYQKLEFSIMVSNCATPVNFAVDDICINEPVYSPPLPLALLDFTATKQTGSVKLNWTTAQEQNTKNFEVEFSKDGLIWEKIGTVAAAGNSSVEKWYSMVHTSPVNGANYYRLKLVDLDGRYNYSVIRLVNFSKGAGITVLPNPVKDRVFVSANDGGVLSLSLYSIEGKILQELANFSSGGSVDMSQYPVGTYMLKVQDQKGMIEVKKLIKQ